MQKGYIPPKTTSLPTDSKRILTDISSCIYTKVLVLEDHKECVSTAHNVLDAELLIAAYMLICFLQTL